ncbi:Putative ribonuclease H protein [Apostasia shenzhenica]|uniref:Ribonuclease H protein n=1 Tax=Apostasia shenzhenica TaxID=1088818 RepID=A0A2I0A6J1_9ASPA|nr:Putative ribonuclease H protein [Apostasia shenzhenica]
MFTPSYSSPGFKKLIHARDIAEPHIKWIIGEGDISFWFDNWSNKDLSNYKDPCDRERNVSWFLDDNSRWNEDKISIYLPNHVGNEILDITIHKNDKMIWDLSINGKFSFKDTWNKFRHKKNSMLFWKIIWLKNFPDKISFLAWQIIRNYLPTEDRMKDKGFQLASRCVWGCDDEENTFHIFWTCERAKKIWQNIFQMMGWQFDNGGHSNMDSLFAHWSHNINPSSKGCIFNHVILFTCWSLWKARNNKRFRDIKQECSQISASIRHLVLLQHWAFPYKAWQLKGNSYFLNLIHSNKSVCKLQLDIKVAWKKSDLHFWYQ